MDPRTTQDQPRPGLWDRFKRAFSRKPAGPLDAPEPANPPHENPTAAGSGDAIHNPPDRR